MKKLSLLMVAFMMSTIMVSCGGDNVEAEGEIALDIQSGTTWNEVYAKTPTVPEWVSAASWIEGSYGGMDVYLITVEGVGTTEEKAEINADLEKIETLASVIKQLATTKLGAASSGMLNDEEDIDTYFEQTTAAVSENVDTSGAIMTESYWIFGQMINETEGTVEDEYHYYKRYAIPIEKVETAMEEAWQTTKEDYPEELQDTVEGDLDYLAADDTEDENVEPENVEPEEGDEELGELESAE